MRFIRHDSIFFCVFAIGVFGTLTASCTSGVGDPCLPEQIPSVTQSDGTIKKGFVVQEAYIESSSVQCQTRVCGVFYLRGDPSPNCNPATSIDNVCPSGDEIDNRVYCTCRCKTPDPRFAVCSCPSGYKCTEVLEKGDPGTRGSYCVKAGYGQL